MKKILGTLVAVGALWAFSVQAQLTVTVGSTNLPYSKTLSGVTNITASATSNFTAQAIQVNPGFGVGLYCQFKVTTNYDNGTSITTALTTTGNQTFTFYGCQDVYGTNWFPAFTVAKALNGTNKVNFWTNIPAAWIDSLHSVKLYSMANGDATNQVTLSSPAVLSRVSLVNKMTQ